MAAEASHLSQLAGHVQTLSRECPWTKSQRTADMLYWTRKECLEVEEVLRRRPVEALGSVQASSDLTKELGDVLFDVMMMIQVSQRDHPGVTLEACAASAVEKLKTRTPYIFGAPAATTVQEANAHWEAGKRAERQEAAAAAAASAAPTKSARAVAAAAPRPAPAALPPAAPALGLAAATAPTLAAALGAIKDPRPAADDDADDADGGLSEWLRDFSMDNNTVAVGESTDSEDEDFEEETSF